MPKQSKRDRTKEIAEELDVFDTMLSSLVELLEEKGILTYDEWESRIRKNSERAKGLSSYRDIQFKRGS
jgi:Mn-dependent DtxR family transcriptional regulator